MEKTKLGRTEMMVSKLGFGGIPIQRISEDAAVALVKQCLDLGIIFIDTAHGYATSEERIGKAISGRRERLIIATKTPSRTREGAEEHLKLSLKQLGVESIDLYQFQFPDIVSIPGIEKRHEIEEIVRVLEGPWSMTKAEQCEMERLRKELDTKFCRRFDYCQPCTEEISISTVMVSSSFILQR